MVLRNNPDLKDSASMSELLNLFFCGKLKIKKIDIGNCGISDLLFIKMMELYEKSSKTLEQLIVKNNPGLGLKSYTALSK